MRVLRHYTDVPSEATRGVIAIGSFDGVHRGHRVVIGAAAEVADRLGAPLGVLTFEPHPRTYFRPDQPSFRLSTLRSKAHRLEALGVDVVFALHFDAALASMSAQDFVMRVLVEGLKARHLVVGYDFIFGQARGGDPAVLGWMGDMEGFGITVIEPVGDGSEIFSSTRVRQHLAEARPQAAADLLGHWWSIEGRVQHGDRRGRTIGFPTANIELDDLLIPAHGVYAVRVGVERDGGKVEWHLGVANLGKRPTVGKEDVLLEAHLFDFQGDLYGQHVRVELVEYIRAVRKFAG
ncbi:MAG TPA: bifunctional riboflavin kinase/FAD synthetase, partial [Candidatus Cybelea sp.]|nr:bifunctional riboflavin kinase/FAD synthetase [Candidatus Cybelea sp.]